MTPDPTIGRAVFGHLARMIRILSFGEKEADKFRVAIFRDLLSAGSKFRMKPSRKIWGQQCKMKPPASLIEEQVPMKPAPAHLTR